MATKRRESVAPDTDALAERLNDRGEVGLDLTGATRAGRKSLAGGGGKSPRINLRMTEELYRRALDRAQREGKTVSELARDALEAYVGRGRHR